MKTISVRSYKQWKSPYRSYNLSLTDIQHAQQWKMSCCQLSNPAMHKISYVGSLKVTGKGHTVHIIKFRQQTALVFMDACKSRIFSVAHYFSSLGNGECWYYSFPFAASATLMALLWLTQARASPDGEKPTLCTQPPHSLYSRSTSPKGILDPQGVGPGLSSMSLIYAEKILSR